MGVLPTATPRSDFELTLSVEKVQPQITVDSLVEAVSRAGTAVARSDGGLHDREGGRVPPGARRAGRLRRARRSAAQTVAERAPVQVDTHHLEGERKTRLVVNLSRKAIGRVALAVQLQKDLTSPSLLDADRQGGRDRLADSARGARTARAGHGPIGDLCPGKSARQPRQDRRPAKHLVPRGLRGDAVAASRQKPAELRPVLAFAYTQEPVELTLAAERASRRSRCGSSWWCGSKRAW